MNWSDVGELIGDAAPMIGKLIPLPGAAFVGDLIGQALGTKAEPDAVAEMLKSDPDAITKIIDLEQRHRERFEGAMIQAASNDIASVNATMQAESKSDAWYQKAWRPFWGFLSAIAWAWMVGAIGYAIAFKNSMDWLNMVMAIPDTLFLIPLAILGVASWHRGKEKRAAAGEQQTGGIVGKLIEKVTG